MYQQLTCPQCGLPHVETLNRGRQYGAVAGAIIGAAMSIPSNAAINTTITVLTSAIAGAMGCGIACSEIGALLDRKILNNYVCIACGHEFGVFVD